MNSLPIKNRNRQQQRQPSRSHAKLLRKVHSARGPLRALTDAAIAEAYAALRSRDVAEPRRTSKRAASSQRNHVSSETTLTETLALALESLHRTTGMLAYDVQLLAGIAMARGAIAEMQTGEGKTLTTMFPAATFAISGRGVHIATVNSYLAQRDYEFLRDPLELLGLTVGISQSGDSPEQKRFAYACDVTFSTGYELGFDFLRDQISLRSQTDRLGSKLRRDLFGSADNSNALTQRGFAAAIIDEVDSVLIDEATTPLVLSAGSLGQSVDESTYFAAASVAQQLIEDEDFIVNRSNKTIVLTNKGIDTAEQFRGSSTDDTRPQVLLRPWRQYVESAIRAEQLMVRDVNYIVRNQKVEIVDQYTGRIFSDRNWRDGLHQAVEAKESVPITEERKTIARVSRQRYFQRYEQLCGMTGTADGHQLEFRKCYNVPTVIVPRRKTLLRVEITTRYFQSESDKFDAIVQQAIERLLSGQPVLIGTRTIDQSQRLSRLLTAQQVAHQVLNGVQDDAEATLIASAGSSGTITVATNMAGRGTDIKLDTPAIESGGLHVIGVERNSSVRIDRQLLGRSGRQGDPGSGQFFVSAEDDLVLRFDANLAKSMARINKPTGVASRAFDRRITSIQKTAEQASYQARRDVMREELWLDQVKKTAG